MPFVLKHKKYFDRDDLLELRKRQEQINQQSLIAEALILVKNTWLKQLYPKYSLRKEKDYHIEIKTGLIKEIKQDEQQKH